jgi:tetratricopeptide (TPR) repeat protein
MSESELERIYQQSDALRAEHLLEEEHGVLLAAMARYPDDAELCLRVGRSYATDSPERAADFLRRAAELAGGDPWKVTRCAVLLVELTKFADAERYAQRAMECAGADFPYQADLAYVMGRVAYERGDYAPAQDYLTTAFEGDQHVPEHGFWLAHFHYTVKEDDVTALTILARALRHGPDDPELKSFRNHILRFVNSGIER